MKPGPKGPRSKTTNRIKKSLHDIRSQAPVRNDDHTSRLRTALTVTESLSPQSADGQHAFSKSRLPYQPLPRWPQSTSGPPAVTHHDTCAYLKMYHDKMYAIWPVVDTPELIAKLGDTDEDPETRALAYSVCAATGAQLRLADTVYGSVQNSHDIIDRFAFEAQRYRAMLDCRENATISRILTPFFLSMYYSSKLRRTQSTLLLREALTLCELSDLDKEAGYATLQTAEQEHRRKVFWLLFVTERGTAIQQDMSTVLRHSIKFPRVENDKDPVLLKGFLSLVRLFVAIDGTLTGGPNQQRTSAESLTKLQQRLQTTTGMPTHSNEVQKTDISISQQWMRILGKSLTLHATSVRYLNFMKPILWCSCNMHDHRTSSAKHRAASIH